jgi:hypothetical protein
VARIGIQIVIHRPEFTKDGVNRYSELELEAIKWNANIGIMKGIVSKCIMAIVIKSGMQGIAPCVRPREQIAEPFTARLM